MSERESELPVIELTEAGADELLEAFENPPAPERLLERARERKEEITRSGCESDLR